LADDYLAKMIKTKKIMNGLSERIELYRNYAAETFISQRGEIAG
jgi:hypothetical protein